MESLEALKAREEELGREWAWLHAVINRVARYRADKVEMQTFRILQEQCRVIGQRLVEVRMRLAEAERQ